MLILEHLDLIEDMALGGDLLILSSLRFVPKFRGNKRRHRPVCCNAHPAGLPGRWFSMAWPKSWSSGDPAHG